MTFEHSDEQKAVFEWVARGSGSLVLEAVAGAGKTSTLIAAMRLMHGQVWYGVFNRKNAVEAQRKTADLTHVETSTFHSLGFKCLRRASKTRLEVNQDKVRDIVNAQLVGTDREHWARAVTELCGKAKMAGFGVRGVVELPKRADWFGLIEKFEIMDMIEDEGVNPNRLTDCALAALEASNADRVTIDTEDMIYQTLLRGLKPYPHDWVLVDEAQDSSATRIELARRTLKPGGRLVAVGDPHQAIFGFAGADNDSLDKIRTTFKAQTLKLSYSYRCPRAVVDQARAYVGHIHAAPSAPQGEHLEMSYGEMRKFAAPGDAILCRSTAPLMDACFELIRAGTRARIEGRNLGEGLAKLAGRWKVKSLTGLEAKLVVYLETESAKLSAKGDEMGLERLHDRVATLRVLVDRAREEGVTTVAGLQALVRSMFGDSGAGTELPCVVLSTAHKSKGLEWKRVFLLGRRQLMPSKRAKQAWQAAQEVNLCYVACTRAQETLVDVPLKQAEQPKTQAGALDYVQSMQPRVAA